MVVRHYGGGCGVVGWGGSGAAVDSWAVPVVVRAFRACMTGCTLCLDTSWHATTPCCRSNMLFNSAPHLFLLHLLQMTTTGFADFTPKAIPEQVCAPVCGSRVVPRCTAVPCSCLWRGVQGRSPCLYCIACPTSTHGLSTQRGQGTALKALTMAFSVSLGCDQRGCAERAADVRGGGGGDRGRAEAVAAGGAGGQGAGRGGYV